jgi:single-strand DNA-binding protein
MALHKLILIGRLVGEPQVRTFSNGGKVAKFGLPVNFTRRKKNPETGQWEGESFIIDVDVFNRENGVQLADLVQQYLKKGSQVYVEGRLKPNEYTSREGTKVFKPVLVADIVEFLDRPSEGTGTGETGMRATPASGLRAAARPAAPESYDDESAAMPAGGHQEEEIPF